MRGILGLVAGVGDCILEFGLWVALMVSQTGGGAGRALVRRQSLFTTTLIFNYIFIITTKLQRQPFFHSDGIAMNFFEGTIAIDGF